MKTTLRQVEHLERARQKLLTDTNPSDAKAMLREKLNRTEERLRASGEDTPWPILTVEEVKLQLRATLDRIAQRT